MYIAICDGTTDSIYGCGKTKNEAEELLWLRVQTYLQHKNALETQHYDVKQLADYFGSIVIKVKSGDTGFLRG
jgi:hypothetical protein